MKKPKAWSAIIWFPLFLSIFITLIVALLFFMGGYWRVFIKGPQEVIAKTSPDDAYNAFVTNSPSIDGPNHGLFIETADKSEFLEIARLVEDVDFIKDIIWSDDSKYVVFWSKDYLTLVTLADYSSQRIYLGKPWIRNQKGKRYTFTSQDSKQIEWVKFTNKGLEYQEKGQDSAILIPLPQQ